MLVSCALMLKVIRFFCLVRSVASVRREQISGCDKGSGEGESQARDLVLHLANLSTLVTTGNTW